MKSTTKSKNARVARTSVVKETPNILEEQIESLHRIIPEAFSESKVDFEKLRAILGETIDTRPERFTFAWAGKRNAIQILQMPTRATLIPARNESVDFDNTKNLFIEGDNLEVMKLLYKAYFGKVKVIYIDPPYNTGNDFVYPDNYADPLHTYLKITGQKDTEGNLLTSNPETSGRFHSTWLSMVYPRLFLARQLLSDDGSVWMSIDDTEVANLREICNEVFGEENFVATFLWEKRTTRENRRVFSFNTDYILCYAKNKDLFQASRKMLPLSKEVLDRYSNPDNDPRGDWQSVSLNAQAGHATPNQFYTIKTPGGRALSAPPGRCWSVTKPRMDELIRDKRVWFGKSGNNVPRLKVFLSEAEEGLTPQTLWTAASLTVNKLMKGGTVRQTEVTVKSGDNLRAKTNLPEYEEFAVDEVNLNTNRVIFGNGMEIVVGGSQGADKEALFEAQIRYTIEEHFRKQRRLRDRGIKVLSLFFIDRVDNYATADGIIRRYFTSAFDELKKKYSDWQSLSADDVQASYFAFTKRKGGRIELEDSASGESKKDEAAYDLIMKDKERLLSFDTKEAFIFSHSALREGWDNPNIFQICTLHQTTSEIRKRQEVGRGVRLAVSQIGERTHDPEVNVLTVVANQSYEDYVRQLQEEIHEEYGEGVELPPKPPNARKPATVRLRKEYVLKPEFKELWDKIKGRTRYYVNIDTEQVITEAVAEVDKLQIKTPRIVISKAELKIDDEGDFEAYLSSTAKTVVDLAGRYPLPNLVEIMAYLLEHTTPPVRLSRKTLVEIFLRTKNKKAALDNPFEFASEVVRVLKEQLADHLVNGMQYEKIDDWYEMSRLEELIVPAWEGHVVPAEHSVYDNVIFDSEIERKFVEDLEKRREVKMYIKLPSWFEVDTPVGKYNPDWAIVWEWTDTHGEPNGKPLLYLVSETKGATIDKLRSDERRKVQCGEKHFQGALGTRYRLVQNASELP